MSNRASTSFEKFASQYVLREAACIQRAREIAIQHKKDEVLRAQQERLQAKVEDELRRAGAGARSVAPDADDALRGRSRSCLCPV